MQWKNKMKNELSSNAYVKSDDLNDFISIRLPHMLQRQSPNHWVWKDNSFPYGSNAC